MELNSIDITEKITDENYISYIDSGINILDNIINMNKLILKYINNDSLSPIIEGNIFKKKEYIPFLLVFRNIATLEGIKGCLKEQNVEISHSLFRKFLEQATFTNFILETPDIETVKRRFSLYHLQEIRNKKKINSSSHDEKKFDEKKFKEYFSDYMSNIEEWSKLSSNNGSIQRNQKNKKFNLEDWFQYNRIDWYIYELYSQEKHKEKLRSGIKTLIKHTYKHELANELISSHSLDCMTVHAGDYSHYIQPYYDENNRLLSYIMPMKFYFDLTSYMMLILHLVHSYCESIVNYLIEIYGLEEVVPIASKINSIGTRTNLMIINEFNDKENIIRTSKLYKNLISPWD